MQTIERLAGWAAELGFADIPAPVVDLGRAQRRSVLAAVAASAHDRACRRVLDAVAAWASPGPAPLIGAGAGGARVRVEDALYAASALSIALDFDDYLCFAHTGHSAVLVPLLVAAETAGSGTDQLVAQIVANEIGARLGAACLVGPLNGQLWSFVHAAGAALAAGRLLGLDARRLAHALALALWQAPRPTVPGFMAPDSKLLTAAEPSAIGLRAARLAGAGVTGPLDLLDHPRGFLHAFAHAPLPGLLGGLGEGWATTTLCIKAYPGCAYVDTTADALLELGPPLARDVERVEVHAGLLTCGMDGLSAEYGRDRVPTPVTVTFSIPWNVAVLLVGGRLTPDEVDADWLEANRHELASTASRVGLRHDWELTARSTDAFAPLLPPASLARDRGVVGLLRGAARTRAEHPSLGIGLGDLGALARLAQGRGFEVLRARGPFWDPTALERFAMTFPARVRVVLRDGREEVAEAAVPRGGAGHPTEGPAEVSRAKLAAWAPRLWGDAGATALAEAIDRDDAALFALLG